MNYYVFDLKMPTDTIIGKGNSLDYALDRANWGYDVPIISPFQT